MRALRVSAAAAAISAVALGASAQAPQGGDPLSCGVARALEGFVRWPETPAVPIAWRPNHGLYYLSADGSRLVGVLRDGRAVSAVLDERVQRIWIRDKQVAVVHQFSGRVEVFSPDLSRRSVSPAPVELAHDGLPMLFPIAQPDAESILAMPLISAGASFVRSGRSVWPLYALRRGVRGALVVTTTERGNRVLEFTYAPGRSTLYSFTDLVRQFGYDPLLDVTPNERLVWQVRRVPDTKGPRLQLLDSRGRVLFTRLVPMTALAVPAGERARVLRFLADSAPLQLTNDQRRALRELLETELVVGPEWPYVTVAQPGWDEVLWIRLATNSDSVTWQRHSPSTSAVRELRLGVGERVVAGSRDSVVIVGATGAWRACRLREGGLR